MAKVLSTCLPAAQHLREWKSLRCWDMCCAMKLILAVSRATAPHTEITAWLDHDLRDSNVGPEQHRLDFWLTTQLTLDFGAACVALKALVAPCDLSQPQPGCL